MKNREFKFRYWDTATNINWKREFRYFNLEPKNLIGCTIIPIDRSDRYVIQQFTGFTDKNGKDVYEGDIFDSKNHIWDPIKFVNGKFVANLRGCRVYDLEELVGGEIKSKVIGNIFENPEL